MTVYASFTYIPDLQHRVSDASRNGASRCIKGESAVCVSLLDRWNLGAALREPGRERSY